MLEYVDSGILVDQVQSSHDAQGAC